MRKALLAALCLACPATSRAFNQLAGADVLNYPVDVRSLGMGEASQAVAFGAGGVPVNPAAINDVRSNQLYFTHGFYLAGIGLDYLGYGLALGKNHFGFGYYHAGYETQQGRDDAGNPTVTFGPSDTVYGFTYGRNILGADVAATLKYVDSRILDSAQAVTADVGLRYRIGDEWSLALSGRNLGGELKYDQTNAPLPTLVAGGVGWRPFEDWRVTLDVVDPVYAPVYVAIGNEYVWPVSDSLRLALRFGANTKAPDLGAFAAVKVGAGVGYRGLDLDYAFNPAGDLGQTHHVSLSYRFDWHIMGGGEEQK